MSKWTTRNRASVITSNIDIKVLMKEQLEQAIRWCIENDFDFEWTTIHGDSLTPDEYILSIPTILYAAHLANLAAILDQSDYGSDLRDA